jgi:hypothetical protein
MPGRIRLLHCPGRVSPSGRPNVASGPLPLPPVKHAADTRGRATAEVGLANATINEPDGLHAQQPCGQWASGARMAQWISWHCRWFYRQERPSAAKHTLDWAYSRGDLHRVADQLASHLSGPTWDWLAAHLHHHGIQHAVIPVDAVWLNRIEGGWLVWAPVPPQRLR